MALHLAAAALLVLNAIALPTASPVRTAVAQDPSASGRTSVPVTAGQWHGHSQQKFQIDRHDAYVVVPAVAAAGKPWIWRTAWPDFHVEVDLELVRKGFHIGYLEVVDLLGSDACLDCMDQFYRQVRSQWGLAERMAIEPCSRGGLHAYRYAARHPERVACIYGDVPVMDFKSWPFAHASSKASDWPKVLAAYGFKTDAQAMAYGGNPLDQLAPIAKAKIPLRHVVSMDDLVVPPEQNTLAAQRRLRKLGWDLDVVAVANGNACEGHHFPMPEVYESVAFVRRHADVQPDGKDYFTLRDGLANCRHKFTNDKMGRVAFVGGSITHAGGWSDEVMRDLQQRFPATTFQFIAAGIPSVGSNGHAFRLPRDVLSHGPVDLVFLEAAVNDCTNMPGQTLLMLRAMEGVVGQLRATNPMTDIVQLHFAMGPHLDDYAAGRVPETIGVHERVAAHYGCCSLDLAAECAARIAGSQFTWASGFHSDVHPPAYGQLVYASSIARMLDAAFRLAGGAQAHAMPKKPLDPASYFAGRLGELAKAKLMVGFQLDASWHPATGATREGFAEVPALVATSPGATLTYSWKGTAIGLFLAAGPDTGVLEFRVDGGAFQAVDTYTPWSGALHLPWPLVLADGLKSGPHTLELRTTDRSPQRTALHIIHFLEN